jgi:hypothetical protein
MLQTALQNTPLPHSLSLQSRGRDNGGHNGGGLINQKIVKPIEIKFDMKESNLIKQDTQNKFGETGRECRISQNSLKVK